MINKYTSYITVLQCWNTAARKHPTERTNGPYCKTFEDNHPTVYSILLTEEAISFRWAGRKLC